MLAGCQSLTCSEFRNRRLVRTDCTWTCLYDPQQWIDFALSLGANKMRRHDAPDDWYCVMHDPEGNEFCI